VPIARADAYGVNNLEDDGVVQDLRVAGVARWGEDVIISVYGGSENLCGTVRITLSDPGDRDEAVSLAEHWAATDELVTLLTSGDSVSLVVERELFERAELALPPGLV
jgi:hypothetical protein